MSFDLRTTAEDGSCFVESARFRVCSRERRYGIQVPLGGLGIVWLCMARYWRRRMGHMFHINMDN